MNNHNRMSKRKRQAILFFTYGFMTLATLAISAVCVLLILGYRLDVSEGSIEQGGLLQFRSLPSAAQITLDGEKLGINTPGKSDVKAGSHLVSLNRAGYHEWKKTVIIKAGQLRWLNYARLIPKTVETSMVTSMENGAETALQTPDRKFLAVIPNSKIPKISIYDIRNADKAELKTITIPVDQLAVNETQESKFEITEWDFGSRFLLLTQTVADKIEYIRIDRTAADGAPRNITKEFNLQFRDMHFSGTSGNTLYTLTEKDLRRVNTNDGNVSQPLVVGVDNYELYRENDIAFVATRADKKIVGVYMDDKETIVRSLPVDQPVMVDMSRYYSNYYLAIATSGNLDIIKDPVESGEVSTRSFATLKSNGRNWTWVELSSSGRFVTVGDTGGYSTYDLETDESFVVEEQISSLPAQPARWLDDFYIVSTQSGKVKIREFDGMNSHEITSCLPSLPAFLNDNGKFLYSFTNQGNKTILQRSKIVLD